MNHDLILLKSLSFINDEEETVSDGFESDEYNERSRPITRRTELNKLKKELQKSETKIKEKDLELEKLKELLRAANIGF